jgi:hypothetical protein
LKEILMRKVSPKEAVARVFPSYDQAMATRVIAWLDRCGYQIVEKEVSVVPPDPNIGESSTRCTDRARRTFPAEPQLRMQ